MPASERAVPLETLPTRERRLLWVGLCFRSVLTAIVGGALLLTLLSSVRHLEHQWIHSAPPGGAAPAAASSRLGDIAAVLGGGAILALMTWLFFQWLFKVPIGKFRLAVVRVEEEKR
ncbi:MAG: hypothetical protein FJ293_04775 [Planctomycetes bacterium]|nr:hypothetical protein [Planctomycetota bacterium]